VVPKIVEHRGRIVKTTGDGMLVEFPSVVDAVRCALEVQAGMAVRNANVSPDNRIQFRVGINLGDIIVDGDDIHGDGVCISRKVHDEAAWRPGKSRRASFRSISALPERLGTSFRSPNNEKITVADLH
jgi:adenylate cyclase